MNFKPSRFTQRNGSAETVLLGLGTVLVLLVLPVAALGRYNVDWRLALAYGVVVNVVTWVLYARDKRHAQTGEWRVPEAQLHLCELLGGWPGAWLAQRWLRHKTAKGSYQVVFWLIVAGHQWVAVDSFRDFKMTRAGLAWMETAAKGRR